MVDSPDGPWSLPALREWLTERIADYLDGPTEEIRTDVSFAENGLDSMSVLMLCGDIEDHLGIPAEPQVAWENRTIDLLAAYLLEQLAQPAR